MAEQNKSIGWVVGMLAVAVAYGGWCFLAADYFQHDPNSGGGKADFWGNSISQLSNFGRVMGHAVQNRLWLLGVIVGLEVGVLILWFVMKRLEKEMSR